MTSTDIRSNSVERAPDAAARYAAVRSHTEALSGPLSPEDQTVQSMPDVSPTKWHRAHTSWFFETFVLGAAGTGYQPFDASFAYLFNSYYEAVGPRHARPSRGLISRPGALEIGVYRGHVDVAMLDLLASSPSEVALERTELGLHHEQQHQELLLMDIKHVLWSNPTRPAYRLGQPPPERPDDRPAGWIERSGGLVDIGHRAASFAFDNESPCHTALLAPFALADRPISCGDWMAFIDDGGYQRAELWLSDGWAMVRSEGIEAPLYWEREPSASSASSWTVFTLEGRQPVIAADPVCHISYYEADAFARWSGARLPTEAEWESVAVARGARRFDVESTRSRPAGQPLLHPRAALAGDMPSGVWEWTASAYLPYPGYRPPEGAIGEYNGKFMVNQHVLRGGACVTPAGHTRATYRNFFPPPARWPFTGARLAKDLR